MKEIGDKAIEGLPTWAKGFDARVAVHTVRPASGTVLAAANLSTIPAYSAIAS